MEVQEEGKWLKGLARLTRLITMLSIWGIVLVILLQIAFRNLFGIGLTWANEFSVYLQFWLVFVGAAINFKEKETIVIEFFLKKFPPGISRFLDRVHMILMTAFILIFLYSVALLIMKLANVLTPAMQMPFPIFYLAPVAGMLIYLIYVLNEWKLKIVKKQP